MDEGTASDQEQAAAICYSIWREAKEKNMDEDMGTPTENKDKGSTAEVAYYIPGTAISFDDVEEFIMAEEAKERTSELTRIFQRLIDNIMWNETVDDKGAAIRQATAQYEARVQSVVESVSENWLSGLAKQIKKTISPKTKPDPVPGLTIWKEANGTYRWLAIYSNKYRDNDHPPEILSEAAHLDFVKAVDEGRVPYPELWHYHVPGSRWGVSDWIAYDKSNGFSLASGTVDPGHEKEAEILMGLDEPIAVSHGMPEAFLEFDPRDPTVYTKYVSAEISDLPTTAAANKLTGFSILKEGTQMIPAEKKEYLRKVGLTDDKIAEIEADLEGKAKQAAESGLEFKETEEVEAAVEEAAPAMTPEEIAEAEVVDLTDEPDEPDVKEQAISKEEIAEAIVAAVKPLEKRLAHLEKSDDEKIAEKAAEIPTASLSALVLKSLSATGSDKTLVGDDENVETPVETKENEAVTGVPWIDSMLVAKQ
jgi:hypothetical protein